MSRKNQRNDYDPTFFKGIAHRGLHGEGISENSLLSFQKAIEAKSAFELDVHLSKDGELIVCHDSELKRVTGKQGIIEELTLQQIKEYKLLDGQTIPTFQEVLALNHEQSLIVTELKVYNKNYKALRRKVMEELSCIKDDKKIVLISFDPRALIGIGKRFKRQLLVCKESSWTLHLRHLFDSLDLECCLSKTKKVMNYRKKGGIVNIWTVENEKQAEEFAPFVDTITYQYIKPDFIKDLLSKKQR